jgi:signal transduction histidine kinase
VRHCGATRLTVEVTIADQLSIDVIDNGRGIPADNQRHSGLANLAHRAEQLGEACQINTAPAGAVPTCTGPRR